MAKTAKISAEQYDPRWFIWTIMFLLVTGVFLTTYISFSGEDLTPDQSILSQVRAKRK